MIHTKNIIWVKLKKPFTRSDLFRTYLASFVSVFCVFCVTRIERRG